MTKTPRKPFWPKRWLRSFAGVALAASAAGGFVWAQEKDSPLTPKSASKTDKPAVPAMDLPKTPKLEAPGTPKERTIAFSMSDKPWADVMKFYADETGLAFNSVEKPPTGTFQFTPPKDPLTKETKRYTISGMTDVINEQLLIKNLILIRGEQTFRLWPADQTIDPSLVRRVTLEELKTLAVRDMVQIVLDLEALNAFDQVNNVRKMMSKVGEVVALEGGRNALIMIDMAGNLRRIVDDLTASEKADGKTGEQYQHKCVYVKAYEAAAHARELIGAEGAPEAQVYTTASTGSRTGMGMGGGDRERRGWDGMRGEGFDWRGGMEGMRGFDRGSGGGGGSDPRRSGFASRNTRTPKVISDDDSNTVYVSGPPNLVSQAKAFLVKFDVGKEPVKVGPVTFETYPVPAGMAENFTSALIDKFGKTGVRIKALSANQIVVYGPPSAQLEIIDHIAKLGKAQILTSKSVDVSGMDVSEAVTLLKTIFPAASSGGPGIEKHPNGTGVVISGRADQVAEVETVLKSIGASEGSIGVGGTPGTGSTTRIISLKEGSAGDLADAIRQLMANMGYKDVNVSRTGGGVQPKPPIVAPKPEMKMPDAPKGPGVPEKKASINPAELKTLGVRDLDPTAKLQAISAQLTEPGDAKKIETGGVIITAIGDKLYITGSDPKAVAIAADLARLITTSKGESYEVFRLNNASATEAARVINEWFNPPPPQQQGRGNNPFAGLFQGGGRGGFGQPAAAADPEAGKPRVRVVAEQTSNSLLVRANLLDILTIKNMLQTVIDVGPGDSKAVVKPFHIEPLKFAVATEVVAIVERVFSESTNRAASQGGTQGGFAAFGGFGGIAGGSRQQPLDALGRPKQVSLTIAADDRTNSIYGTATELMAEEIKAMVKTLEENAKDSTKVVRLVPTRGIDPTMVQQVLDAIQGRAPTTGGGLGTSPFGGGMGTSPFGGGGSPFGGGFGQGGQGTGRFGATGGGFGGPTGRFGGGGAAPGGGFGGGGNRGGGGGNRGGGRNRAPEPPKISAAVNGGPDFFEQRDMEVPQQTLLYDPYEESLSQRRATGEPQTLDPVRLASGKEVLPAPAPAKRTPVRLVSQGKNEPVTPREVDPKSNTIDLTGPRGTVTFSPLNEFGYGILTANNQADLELALKIIEQLREGIKDDPNSGLKLEFVDLDFADALDVVDLVNQLGARAFTGVNAPRPAQPGQFGGIGQQQQQAAGGSVLLIPIPRRNAILMFGPELRFQYYKDLIKQVDVKNTLPVNVIQLKRASSQNIATYLTQFYQARYNETQTGNLIRFSYNTSTNALIVQAGPSDMEEIQLLVQKLDLEPAPANAFRIYRLNNTVAEDLANTIQSAIMQNVLPQGIGFVQPQQQGGAGGFGQGGFGQQGGQQGQQGQQPGGQQGAFGQATGGVRAQLGSATTNTTKTVSLRFMVPGKDGTLESGYLEDVHITPDIRSNSLLVSAPDKTLLLIEAVIKSLDVPSATRAQVNIFTLKKADATLTANLLQQLFSGGSTTQQGGGGQFGQQGGAAGNQSPLRPLLTASGSISEGAGLINVGITIDDRTNSIIVAGSQNDLDAIRAIIQRLEDADIQQRITSVVKLRNAGAVDVANALQPFLTQSLTVINTGLTQTNYLETSRNIIIAAEPITNNLLISATPAALAGLMPVIERLDAQPLQVAIEVLIAEVILNNSEEFGVEVGLQSPVLFQRSVIPTNGSVPFSNAVGGFIPPGTSVNSTITQYTGAAFPFNNVGNQSTTYNNAVRTGIVGMQGITNYGVGRANANGLGGFVFSAGSDTVNVLIRALKTQRRVDNLSRPTVTVLDNQIGSVNIGGLYPYVAGGQFTALGTFQPQINQQQIGTTLTVTPRISPDGRILMRVEPSIIAPEDTLVALGNGQFATAFRQQAVQTTVSVMDGDTVVLGGLISKQNIRQENKVPWLGDLPYIGTAFRYRTQEQEKRELLVIMTPHVIRNSPDSEKLLMDEARKMSWNLREVDRMFGSGPQGAPPPGALPPGVGPELGAPLPPPGSPVPPPPSTTITPGKPVDIMPKQIPPMPSPKPMVPELPSIPPMPSPKPAWPVIQPTGAVEPARGIASPDL